MAKHDSSNTEFGTWQEIRTAYKPIRDLFLASSHADEMKAILNPVAKHIDRIVIVGLGTPQYSKLKQSTLGQLAMIDCAADYLQQIGGGQIKTYSYDARSSVLDRRFLWETCRITDVRFDEAKETEQKPSHYTVVCRGKKYRVKETEFWSSVNTIRQYITKSTLLYLPYLPFEPHLSLIPCEKAWASNTSERVDPLMIIGLPLDGLWDNLTIMLHYTEGKEAQAYMDQWRAYERAWEHLKDDYARKEWKFFRNSLWVYVHADKIGGTKMQEWDIRDQGLTLYTDTAERNFMSNFNPIGDA